MKKLNFTSQEIEILLKPEGEPLGRLPLVAKVYTEYAEQPRRRFVQELCGLVGGSTVYVEITDDGSPATRKTIPVSGWRDPLFATYLDTLADTVEKAVESWCSVRVFGSDRVKWRAEFTSIAHAVHDQIDNQTDKVGVRVVRPVNSVEANGVRSDF